MRRIALALFAIVGVVSAGVFATGAYFSDTITANNYTFTTGTADLKFGFCGPVGIDCSGTAALLDTWTFTTSQDIGPGIENSDCLVVENKGDYDLTLSSALSIVSFSHPDMRVAFEVAADQANSSCQAVSSLNGWQSALDAANNSPTPAGTLAPGQRMYIIQYNRWNSTGNQNHLQNGSIVINTSLEGVTE
jgi:hypothetical protein